MGIVFVVVAIVMIAAVGNAMATPEQKRESREAVRKFARPLAIPVTLLWVWILWVLITG